MLQVVGLEKSYGERLLFKDVSFTLTPGERLALVGRNGTGKSTLFRMILGEESPDVGTITAPRGYRIGHLSQHLTFSAPTIVQEACRGLPAGREDEEYRAHIILSGLGFSEADMERPAKDFSGGFQIRIELARVLLSEPNLLLLDEPTNYLDIVSARWLEQFLREWTSEIIMISHDCAFLDAVATHSMIVHRGTARRIAGTTAQLYALIKQDETIYEQTRINQDRKRKEMEQFVTRFKAKAGTASLAQSRMKMLEKMEVHEELREEPVLDFSFTSAPFHGRAMVEAERIAFTYPARPGSSSPTPILKDFSLTIAERARIAVIGKNGKGKSTLLRILARDLAPNSGELRLSPHTAVGYFGQTNIQRLSEQLTVEEEVTQANPQLHRTRVRAICGTMMFSGDDALKRVRVLSGGERSRVLLGKMLAQPTNLLLLDEPTNHLDIESVAALVESLDSYEGAVVVVTHDEFLLRKLAKRIVLFSDDGVELIEGDYDYFMSVRGWGDEEQAAPSKAKRASKSASAAPTPIARSDQPDNERRRSSPEERRARAEERQRRSELLGPIEKETSAIESKITMLEQKLKQNETLMVEESARGAGARIAELSRESAYAQQQIEELFERLSELEVARKLALSKLS